MSCPGCGGVGWTVESETACCRRGEGECGGRGCTGPEQEQVQVQCPCEGKETSEGENDDD